MKKPVAIVCALAVVTALGLFACSGESKKVVDEPDTSAQTATEQPAQTPAQTPEETTAEPATKPAASESEAEPDFSNLAVGQVVQLDDGLKVVVSAVKPNLKNYDGSKITQVNVAYANAGDTNVSFNPYDWKGEDKNGAQRSRTYYSKAKNELSSGELAPGGKVSGTLYFEGDITKVVYETSFFDSSQDIAWVVPTKKK